MSKNRKALNYQTDPLTVINRIADALYQASAFDDVLQDVMQAVQDYTHADMVTFLAVNKETEMLELRASENLVDDLVYQRPFSIAGSLSGLTIARQEIITSADIAQDKRIEPHVRKALDQHGLHFIISMPVTYQAEAVAVTNLFYRNMPDIPDRAYETLLAIGKILGAALAHAEPQTEQAEPTPEPEIEIETTPLSPQASSIDALELISTLSQKMLVTMDVETALHEALKTLVATLNVTSAYISTLDEDDLTETVIADFLSEHANELESISDLGTSYHLEDDFGDRVDLLKSVPFYIEDKDDPNLPEPIKNHLEEYGACTVLGVPLVVKDKLVGLLDLWESRDNRIFTDAEIAIVQAIANQVAVSIDNMHLYEQVKQELEERRLAEKTLQENEAKARAFQNKLQALQEASLELAAQKTSVALYRRAIELGQEKLEFDRLSLLLFDAETTHMRGTFGIDGNGRILDESSLDRPAPEALHQTLINRNRIILWENVPLYTNGKKVGEGCRGIAPLWNGEHNIGWLTADNLISQVPPDAQQLDLLVLYGDVIGHLIAQKEAEQALQERENLLKIVLDTIPQSVFWKDEASVYLGCNTKFAQDAGMGTPEALIGKTDFEGQWSDEDARKFQLVDRRVMDSGEPELNVIEPQVRSDGHEIWLSANKVPLHDADGNVIGILGTYEDITERRQNELELQRREEEYRELYVNAPVAYVSLDEEGIIVQANQRAIEILKIKPTDLIGTSMDTFYADTPEGLEKASQFGPRLATGENIVDEELEMITAKGEKFWLSISVHPIIDADGQLVGSRAAGIDITEQKRAEDALRNAEATLRKQSERLISLTKSEAITSGDLSRVVREITETAVDVLGVARASIWHYNPDQIILADLYKENSQTHSQGSILKEVDYPHYFRAITKEGTIVAHDAQRNSRTNEFAETVLLPLGITSKLDITAQISGEAKAILSLEHIGKRRHWSIEERNFANSLSDILALALEANDRQKVEIELQETLLRREREVRVSTQIAQEIASATDLTDLYGRVVTQIQEQFGYYFTQLLRYDPALDSIALIEGYGDVGQQMVELNHSVPHGVGIIGTSAATGKSILRPDVTKDPAWQSNPLLPHTKGELAVPIKVGDTVLGVLDVQSKRAGQLNENDVLVLGGLCGQIAIAIESTTLRQEMESRLRELNALQRQMSKEGWQQYQAMRQDVVGYQYNHGGVQPLALPATVQETNGSESKQNNEIVKAPLMIRGEIIGLLGIEDDPERPLTDDDREFLDAITREIAEALESARLFEQTQTALNEQERLTSELETVAQVSTAASTILEIEALLQSVVDLAKSSFGLYHAHIYLVNDNETRLQLKAGAGNIGRLMTLEGREIGINDESLVARSARTRQGVMSNNVRKTIDYLPHPLLPKTESELAVPMIVGDKLVGVMDLQSTELDFFSDDDLKIQRTLASQIAVAVENAQQYAEQVQTAVKLRELDQLKSEFLASMSHELRTPLNSIIGFADVLLEGLDGVLNERMEEDVRLIRESGRHLRDLIGDILDMSKIESGHMELRYEEIDMPQFVNDILATASSLAREKNISLHLDIDENVSTIQADRTRLRQILLNVMGNAIKFTEKGSVTVGLNHHKDHMLVSIRDTGIGIKEENIAVVFEQFRQIDGGLNRIAGGTGLGMPITKKLVDLHGGEIWIESVYGQGSTFLFTIPYDTSRRRDQAIDVTIDGI